MKIMKKLLGFVLMFAAVIMISNTTSFAAVQYTDNVIPVMTSNTSPSGEASASSSYRPAYRAFDNDLTNTSWGTSKTTGWLAYEFDTERTIVKYTIHAWYVISHIKAAPKDWTFEGWSGNEWVILDTQTNITFKAREKKEFTFNNTNSYKKYRLNISANDGQTNGTTNLVVGQLEMMEAVSPQVPAPTNLVATAGDKSITLSWDAVPNASSYIVKRTTVQGGTYDTIATVTATSGSSLSYKDTNVASGTTYYYVVTAMVTEEESTNSNVASATPKAAPETNVLKVVLEVKEQLQLSVDDDLDENLEMLWTSSNNSVATVDSKGVVTALAPGNTVITVTSKDGSYTDHINVLVLEDADDYRLAVDLKVGNSCRLTVDDCTNTVKVNWASMDPTVATISSKGKVTAVDKGLTMVTATDDQGNIIGQIYIRVRL